METPVSEFHKSEIPESATELIKEIAVLEKEVKDMEKHLLLLYRKAFDQRLESLSTDSKTIDQMKPVQKSDHSIGDTFLEEFHEVQEQQIRTLDASIHRCYSSLSQHSAFTVQSSPLAEKAVEALYSYQSMPLTLLERGSDGGLGDKISLGDHLSNQTFSQIRETANWVSEQMVRCMSSVYCQLSSNPVVSQDFSSPKASFTSSMISSPHHESNLWSPPYSIYTSFDYYKEFSTFNCDMVEITQISRDSVKMRAIDPMLQNFRALVTRLEEVNLSKLKHEEKLAFWINVHNALVMHAFLIYGIPQMKLNRVSLLLKVAYNVGGQTVSVPMIQNYILGRQLTHPGQWFQRLFHTRKKFRTGDKSKLFALDHPQPLSYFSLCCGTYSDPPVRIYTPKRVFQDLIAARGEYILSNYRIDKEHNKIMLPKLVDNYVNVSGLHPADFMGIIEQILPENPQINGNFRHRSHRKGLKGIGWVPHNFAFRYQFPKELFS